MSQTHASPSSPRKSEEIPAEQDMVAQGTPKVDAEKLKADIDALLDELDETLSVESAAEYVDSFRQRGGQ